jgi:hypothetical protein
MSLYQIFNDAYEGLITGILSSVETEFPFQNHGHAELLSEKIG